jgi:hypothetical protein
MPRSNRLRLSACYNDFVREINRLERFDNQNQVNFTNGYLTKIQLNLLVESIFFTGFRSYESFIREIFVLYCMEKPPRSNSKVVSYLKPKSFLHSEQLLKSSMSFLDWNNPDTIIERAETYLANGHPVKLPYTTNRVVLKEYKLIRNQIAHDSLESFENYKKVVRRYYHGTLPLTTPSPGEFLVLPSRTNHSNYLLLDFFDLMRSLSYDLT